MSEFQPKARERMEALKEYALLRREAERSEYLRLPEYFQLVYEMIGHEQFPLRLEAEARFGRLLLPSLNRHPVLHDAYVVQQDNKYSALNGPRLSHVLELPQDNVIHLRGGQVEREVDGFAVSVYESGLLRFFHQQRRVNLDSNIHTIIQESEVDKIFLSEFDEVRLMTAFGRLFPHRGRRSKAT